MNKSIILLILISVVGISKLNAAESSPQLIQGTDTLVVYKDVPGLIPSDKYTIRVRSAATNNKWIDVFANVSLNRALELEDAPSKSPTGKILGSFKVGYSRHTGGWSHAYGNIEMNTGQAVEVEIAAKNGFKIGGKDFFKATVHPAQKASAATIVGGKIYFTITKPAQIYIDINGQMDDYNAAINPIGHPVHAISLFANPVIKKPTLTGSRVLVIEPGTSSETINSTSAAIYDTIYFKPGVHDIISIIKVHPGKTIYLPGDAYLYGVIDNVNVPQGIYTKNGENITIYGYGTICGAKLPHPDWQWYYPSNIKIQGIKPIVIDNPLNTKIHGLCISDPANHSIQIADGPNTTLKWVKTITWRASGDGLGGFTEAEDCFIRSQDDCSYAKANKIRCTFWKDDGAHLFHMAGTPENTVTPIIIEDCDVLYARLRTNPGNNGGGFNMHGRFTPGQRKINLIFRNFRFHDKLINMPVFHLKSYSGTSTAPTKVGSSLSGILFQNISIAGIAPGNNQKILGCEAAPWYGGLIFDHVTIGDTLITHKNYKNYFETNEYVKDLIFK